MCHMVEDSQPCGSSCEPNCLNLHPAPAWMWFCDNTTTCHTAATFHTLPEEDRASITAAGVRRIVQHDERCRALLEASEAQLSQMQLEASRAQLQTELPMTDRAIELAAAPERLFRREVDRHGVDPNGEEAQSIHRRMVETLVRLGWGDDPGVRASNAHDKEVSALRELVCSCREESDRQARIAIMGDKTGSVLAAADGPRAVKGEKKLEEAN
ncbi:hypothetical protein MMC13_004949 [Lambiella insularis]|nr:hypothetical protein [Lambiella insularis]